MTRKGSRRLVAVIALVVFAVCVCVAGAAASGRVTLTGLGLSAKPHAGVVSNHVLFPTAWTTKAVSPTPPRCSAADTRRNAFLWNSLYSRFCGPARAVVHLNGKTYRIRGGHCLPRRSPRTKTKRRRLNGMEIGLLADSPAPAGRGISLIHWMATQPRPVTIEDSEIEVPGTRVAASGTIIVGKGLKGGTFSLYSRDASGPTGVTLTGSWTCG